MGTRTFTQSESGKIGMGCLIAALVVIVLVGVGIYFAVTTGLDMIGEQVQTEIRDNPVVVEHLGTLQEVEFDLKATGALGKEDALVFNLVGSKGKGVLTVDMDKENDDKIVKTATLRMEDGKTYELPIDAPADAPAEEPAAPETE